MPKSPLPSIDKNTRDTADGVNELYKSYDKQSDLLGGFIEGVKQGVDELNKSYDKQSDLLEGGRQGTNDLNKSYDKQSNLLEEFIEGVKQQQTKTDLLKDNKSGSNIVANGKGVIGNTLSGAGDAAAGIGGLAAGIGGLAGGLGVGGGALMAGAGILAAGGGYFLEQLNEFDGKKIRQNVNELFGIADDAGGRAEFLKDGGTFFLAMTGIGISLGLFAAGGAAAVALDKFDGDSSWVDNTKESVKNLLSLSDEVSGGQAELLKDGGAFFLAMSGIGIGLGIFGIGGAAAVAVTKFESGDWAGKVKDQVGTLLEIVDLPNAGLGGAASFIATMGGLALGLAAFALGKGAEGIVSVGTEGLEAFTGEPFAERVKSEVKTLLEIPSLPGATLGGVSSFIGVMAGLAAGLAAFALGKGAEGIVAVGQDGLSYFTDQPPFAERVKAEVETLLSITTLPGVGADTAKFIGVMGGIATGLTAFSLSKGISGAITFFTGGESFADGIKTEVGTLLSVTDNLKDDGSTFSTAMGNIATGLLKFSTGEFGASFAGIGSSILNFLSGGESPIEKVLSIADNAGKLTEGANALGAIADNLNKFGAINFDGDKFNIKGFANDLKDAVPIIESAIMGDSGGIFGKKIFGLASPEIDYAKAAESIDVLRTALKVEGVAGNAATSTSSAVSTIVNNYITNNNTSNSSSGGGGGGDTIIMSAPSTVGGMRPDR